MKLYRRHHCGRRHRSYRTLAACIWKRAVMLGGEGPFVTLSHCRGPGSVMLHATQEHAEAAKRIVDSSACGGACRRQHEIVQLVDPANAEPWATSGMRKARGAV